MENVKKSNINELTFEEIFKECGLYTNDTHVRGFCFEVYELHKGTKVLLGVQYKNEKDLCPSKNNYGCYEFMLKQKYKKVFNVKELFGDRIE